MAHADAPRVGLSARLMHRSPAELGFNGRTLQYLEQSVAHWLMSYGAIVFMLPTLVEAGRLGRASVRTSQYIQAIDGLVLQGGSDVSPASYGEVPLDPAWAGDRVRDLYEIDLFWECLIQGKPVLGICRGAQLINVALGGTLFQDISTQIPGARAHVDAQAYDGHHHEIEFIPETRLAQLFAGRPRARVTSIHHQAVKDLGRGLVVEARSVGDGVVEAIRWTGPSHVVGVQWHPEFHSGDAGGLLDGSALVEEFMACLRSTD